MQDIRHLEIVSDRKKIVLGVSAILYILANGKDVELHISGGRVYRTRASLSEPENKLGAGFIRVHRGCIVSAMAIHDIGDRINLVNGESLEYSRQRKNGIIAQFQDGQRRMIDSFVRDGVPATWEEYHRHYESFDAMPFAFADIEMVFNEKRRAVDWIFRYGNPALAKLEKLPLEQLIDQSFGSLFHNMNAKWLRLYERATLYGETLEVVDYSPEIDTYLKVSCFPTFRGHCGCILFDLEKIRYLRNSSEAQRALELYLNRDGGVF